MDENNSAGKELNNKGRLVGSSGRKQQTDSAHNSDTSEKEVKRNVPAGRPEQRKNSQTQKRVAEQGRNVTGQKSSPVRDQSDVPHKKEAPGRSTSNVSRSKNVSSQKQSASSLNSVSDSKAEISKNNAENEDPKSKPKKIRKKRKEHPGWRRFGIALCSLFLVGMITVSSIGLYVLKYMSDFVNGEVAIDLDEYKANQSQTTILFTTDSDGKEVELIRLHGEENRIWVGLDEMPQDLLDAYVSIEDKRFYQHSGVDWIRTVGVIVKPSNSGQGGSTITQQLIKNLTGENGKTYVRKFKEIENALNLEKHYSKETILEAYLNTLYLDAGCYGVQTASEYYFGKNVSDLNLAECACIAAITNAPRTYDPIINPKNNKDRRDACLGIMLSEGYITKSEYDEAIDYKLIFTTDENYVPAKEEDEDDTPSDDMITVDENNVGAGTSDEEEKTVQSYYVDYVIDKVIEDLQNAYSYSYNEAWKLVYYGGLKIHVAVDMNIQSELEDIYYNRKGFPSGTNSYGEQVQSCMVIMDYSGRVMGIIGQAGEKTGARCLDIATDSMRQPGSSIKPLSIYSLAINTNEYSWSYPMVKNAGITVNGETWPLNYGGDPGTGGYETIQAALAPSHNTVPAQILRHMGVETSFNWLKDTFKMTSLSDSDMDYSPLAVGGMTNGVYAIEMCAAYTTFGNGGMYYEPYCYYTVTNSSGSVVYLTHNDSGEQVMKDGTSDVMNKLLQTVVTSSNGTGRNYAVSGFDMFAKTGTTTDEKDRWFIGGTPYYVCAVWMGYSLHAEPLDYSTNYCGQLYRTVMNDIHEDLPSKSFSYGDNVVRRAYCTRTGLLAGSSCYSTASGWYKADSLPSTCTSCASGSSSQSEEKTTSSSEQTTAATAPTTAAAADGGAENVNADGGE